MIKVTVKNLKGEVTNQANFDSQGQADAWVMSQTAIHSFGKPERWVHEDDLSIGGEDKTKATASQMTGGPEEEKMIYKFAAEYSVEFEDITAQMQQLSKNNEALSYLASTDWMVLRAMEVPSKPVPADIALARSNARASVVKS